MRAGLGAHPHDLAARSLEGFGYARLHQVDPQQALERYPRVQPLNLVGEALDPAGLEAENVIREPDMVGREVVFEPAQFSRHVFRGADVVPLAVDGLRAPVAVVRATARRDHVHGIVAVPLVPDFLVAFDVHQVPGGERELVEFLHEAAWLRVGRVWPGQAGDRGEFALCLAGQKVERFGQGDFALAYDNSVNAVREILLLVVGGVGA